jgi:hypothetical protein
MWRFEGKYATVSPAETGQSQKDHGAERIKKSSAANGGLQEVNNIV